MVTSNPSRKRPYQPQIAAFLPIAEDTITLPFRETATSKEQDLRVPHEQYPHHHHQQRLPPTYIQSSLLNVGMRVRKAVPGGYQTHKTPSKLGKENATSPTRIVSATAFDRSRELQPFADTSWAPVRESNALHDIGGWGVQPTMSSSSSYALGGLVADEGYGDFPSSQESNSSTDSIPASRGKRAFDEVDDDEEGEEEIDAATASVPGSDALARGNPFEMMMQQRGGLRSRRRMARRRYGLRSVAASYQYSVPDFEEATFLIGRDEFMDF